MFAFQRLYVQTPKIINIFINTIAITKQNHNTEKKKFNKRNGKSIGKSTPVEKGNNLTKVQGNKQKRITKKELITIKR